MRRTIIRTATNLFATDQELSFAARTELTPEMRAGCRECIRKQMGDDPFLVNLGLHEPVTVTQDYAIDGLVEKAVCLIAYSDGEYDSLFFVYRSRVEGVGLAAVMGSSYDISACLDGYLEDDRYIELSWDTEKKSRRQMFALPDLGTLFADAGVNGLISGATVEDRLVSVGKMDVQELEMDRVPAMTIDRNEILGTVGRLEDLVLPRELFGGSYIAPTEPAPLAA